MLKCLEIIGVKNTKSKYNNNHHLSYLAVKDCLKFGAQRCQSILNVLLRYALRGPNSASSTFCFNVGLLAFNLVFPRKKHI